MVYRASVCPLSLAYVICARSCMAPTTEYPPSADPVMHSFISIPLTLQSPPDGPSRGANLLWMWLLCRFGIEQSLFSFLEGPALRWCAMQSAGTGWWSHLVPLPFANTNGPYSFRYCASVPAWMLLRLLCQICWCFFRMRQLLALFLQGTSTERFTFKFIVLPC